MRHTDELDLHPSDGDLIQYMDRQFSVDERRDLLAHLSSCDACAERLGSLQAQAESVGSLLAGLDAGVAPDEMTRARALRAARQAADRNHRVLRFPNATPARAAAAVALVVMTGAMVGPVRAWMVDRWEDLGLALGADEAPVAGAAAPAPVLERGSLVSFTPAGDVFVLEIENAQQAGTVTVQMGDVRQASAQIVGGDGEAILVLPAGLQVSNTEASTASYTVILPDDLRLVQVFAGGRPVAILEVEGRDAPWSQVIPLGAGR